MTGTPRATASLMAPVTLPASEHEIRIALAPSLTAWVIRCAWICPSSCGGVSQMISMGAPMLARQVLRRRLGAAARRQEHRVRRALRDHRDADRLAGQRRRADRRRRLPPTAPPARFGRRPWPARTPPTPNQRRPPQPSPRHVAACPVREAARREARARLIENHRDHDRATDDDPLVILIEMQSPDGLADEDNEHGSEHRVDRASPTAAQTGPADDRGSDDV